MKVPVRWLRDFVDVDLSVEDLAHRLTMAGLEAEKIETIGDGWDNVFVGYVEHVERHPDADRLNLVDVVAGEHRLRVVTGAPNIAPGQKVPLALVGARLIDGHSDSGAVKTLKPGVIRGVRSEGMVCSEKELGISDEHEGIMVLDPDAPVGVPLAAYLGDRVIEFEITPNLVHAFSVLGIAREVAALTRKQVHFPATVELVALPAAPDDLVRVDATDLCPRYSVVAFEGLSVGPSPDWMQRRLRAAGLRPINNIVDVTNYVMLEWGQPIHAFDRDRLQEGRIVVRRAKAGETMETLDHQVRELTTDMLVIADAERPVGVAGVIGGLESEVSDSTTSILLETANFDMKSIRHTAKALRLRTDASARFERGLDPNLVADAAARATQLILELIPEAKVVGYRDIYPQPIEPRQLSMAYGRIERVLGVRFQAEEVLDALGRLGLSPSLSEDGSRLDLVIPTVRHDLTIPDDIVEEVARIIGYDTIPATRPDGPLPAVKRDPMYRLQTAARRLLVGAGFAEAVTYVSISDRQLLLLNHGNQDSEPGFLVQAPIASLVRLRNPLQADREVLRPTLIPSLLEIAAENLKHERSVRLAELARVYLPRGRDELPDERQILALVVVGQRDQFDRFTVTGELDFFDLKGAVDAVIEHFALDGLTTAAAAHPALHPGRAAEVRLGEDRLALFGELRPDVAAAFGFAELRVGVAEIDLDLALARQREAPQVRVAHFLPVEQDFAVLVDESTPAAQVEATLATAAGPLATAITLFDVFQGGSIGEGKKSLAYRVTFTAPDRALTDADLGKVRTRIERTLAQRVGGTLRT